MSNKRSTLFPDVPPHVDSNRLEEELLAYWDKEHIFKWSLEQNKDGKRFTFYDGPPYATGKPHYGHILQSSIKDTVLRYKTMQGYYAPRRVGWDCHGLPIENVVEKELGIKNKQEIEQDIEGFNAACRATVHRYVDEFTAILKRIGRWADYDNAYSTLDRDYMESEWWVCKEIWKQGLIYKAFRSTPYCIRCATPLSNFEVSMAYKEKEDMSVYVLIKVTDSTSTAQNSSKPLYLLVWTTTPWTLPGNVAVAINTDINYVTAEYEGKHIILAKDRLQAVLGKDAEVSKTWESKELLQLRYEPLFEARFATEKEKKQSYRLVAGEHVTSEN
ncbi:MAG: class I tRNA ligase family protein, partial [Acidobacteriota bacterium]